jgi:hypothetical protein
MTGIVILNLVFAVLVVGGIVALLGRAIIADNPGAQLRLRRPATRPVSERRREALAARM